LHILPIGDEMVNTFDMSVFPGKTLIADNKCAAAVKHISETTGDWKELPEGPMRQAFKDWAQKNCALHEGMEKVYACAGCERSDIQ
jgi:hypothetical protein